MSVVNTHETVKSRKKPRPKIVGTPVMTRLQPDLLAKLDDWRKEQAELPGRPEAIRRLIESALKKRG